MNLVTWKTHIVNDQRICCAYGQRHKRNEQGQML